MIDINMNFVEPSKLPSLEDVFPIIKDATGVVVYGHPLHTKFMDENGQRIRYEDHSNNQNEDVTKQNYESKEEHNKRVVKILKQFSEKAVKYDLDAGMEVFYSAAVFDSEYYWNLANELNLMPSGGSDFHGPHKSNNHRIGTVSNRYYITKLPIVDFLNNGRKKENVVMPQFASECYENIEPSIRKKYSSKNESIIAKKEFKKAQNMQAILTQFGEEPMPVYHLYSRMLDIKRRGLLLNHEREIVMQLNVDKGLLKNSQKNKDTCFNNIARLDKNYLKLKSLMDIYQNEIEKFKLHDRTENKENFMHYLNTRFINFTKEVRGQLSARKQMYNSFNIDIAKQLAKLNKHKQVVKKADNER
jgi:hypothetical protein